MRAARPSRSVHSCTRPRATRSSSRRASVMGPSSHAPSPGGGIGCTDRPVPGWTRAGRGGEAGPMVDVEAPEQATDDTELVGPKGATPGRILALVAVIAMVMLWVAIFAGYFNK